MEKICVVSANLGGFDKQQSQVEQSMVVDYRWWSDDNLPPRFQTMTPRLQEKIPKFFGWQLAPDYEYYLWVDGNISLNSTDSVKYFYDSCQGSDIVVLKHPSRPNIRQEVRYTRKGINQQSIYMVSRYSNESLKEMYDVIESDKEYLDDLLVVGGIFMYRNTPVVHKMMKEWWYYVTRYIVQDQISFPYVLQNSGVRFNILTDVFDNCSYLSIGGHIYHGK